MVQTNEDISQNVNKKYRQLSYCLNEKSKRLWAATEAKSMAISDFLNLSYLM